ncbi:MAG TPA: aminopeptidase P family protein, partial [Desulfobacteraceae bacterium]|nr:aminopeptidase P family protein [Desulfobacteraceae bacterium]
PRAREESPVKNMVEIKSVKDVPLRINDFYGEAPRVLGFELDVVPVNDFKFYCQLFRGQKCIDASSLIHKVRKIKSKWDIEQMEKAAELSSRTFEYIRENIRPGYSEMEFAGMFETFARKFGHGAKLRSRNYQTEAYPWHVLSGENGGMIGVLDSPFSGNGTSLAFPSGAGSRKLAENEPILIDLGTVLNGYHFDETRMFAIKSMPIKAYDASMASIDIHNEVLDNVRPGVSLEDLFAISVAKAESLGYSEYYLGPPGYKVSFIGHGIGLELVEEPIISSKRKDRLEPGMMFALEPKLTFENEFAAGIESVFLVTETGHRLISRVPVKIFIC